jgi:hypothetical protein
MCALGLAAVRRGLDAGDDYFCAKATSTQQYSVTDAAFSLDGKVIASFSRSQLLAWRTRGWVIDQGEHELGRMYAITPQGHEAVEAVGRVKA